LEAAAQLTRAIAQIEALPGTAALRRERIKLQVALANALMHTKGYASPETKASLDQARLFIERAEALGEPPEDPLLPFSILFGFWAANLMAFNGDALCELAMQFLGLAEKQRETAPLMIGHRIVATSLLFTGSLTEGRRHCDAAIALYDPAAHRSLAARFGGDIGVSISCYRSLALWLLGFPEVALKDANDALNYARESSHAATLMFALSLTTISHIWCGNNAIVNAQADELIALADEKGSSARKATGITQKGLLFALTGKPSKAVQMINSGIAVYRSTRSTNSIPLVLSYLARAYAQLGQSVEAWRCIGEAMTTVEATKERWCEAEVHGTAGEIALMSPEPDATRAEKHFERALAVARRQQAKSWELRAAMSMARLWCDQGKRQQAHDLLAPVYGWFTEGFDTLDLKKAKSLLERLKP
jgi:predicted ATPase